MIRALLEADGPMTCQEIADATAPEAGFWNERFSCWSLGYGEVYAALRRLEREGVVSSRRDDRCRIWWSCLPEPRCSHAAE